MGGEKDKAIIANESQVKELSSAREQESGSFKLSSSFTKEFSSSLWSKPRPEVKTTPRKRVTLTADDFLAHAFGPEFVVSESCKEGGQTGSSSPIEVPGSPLWVDTSPSGSSRRSSTSGQGSTRSQKKDAAGGVLPKVPPRGTFSSVKRSSKLKETKDTGTPPSSEPSSPANPLSDLPHTQDRNSVPKHLLYVQDNPKSEQLMTPEEWREASERRIQVRKLRKLRVSVDVDCTLSPMPLDIDCRPLGLSMGMGLAPIDEDHSQTLKRVRSPRNFAYDVFWPSCEASGKGNSNRSTPESPMIDITGLQDRCDALSLGPASMPSGK
ncbi:hypothetical protein SCHPADRAFT_930907 [Schizopora paradoxa]|uniref:Uncharacterized protein n=1 Tax=Schizopora paradoxa TaxID=27342 RepID=A0A0H2RE59_9AGAM|nr:hypothetical protein SCHPADRAFT_930907 [Schizopora paradoxa]